VRNLKATPTNIFLSIAGIPRFAQNDDGLCCLGYMKLRVHVHARSSRNELIEVKGDWHAYVTAPPLENRANLAVRELLAKKFDVSKSEVILIRGAKSPIKDFEI
jgi:uncharacterized protein YggU (UPF0235/DUF167 family)